MPEKTNSLAALALIEQWIAEDPAYDIATWPAVKKAIEENRLSDRPRFSDTPEKSSFEQACVWMMARKEVEARQIGCKGWRWEVRGIGIRPSGGTVNAWCYENVGPFQELTREYFSTNYEVRLKPPPPKQSAEKRESERRGRG